MFNTKNKPFGNTLSYFEKEGYNPLNKTRVKLTPLGDEIKYKVLGNVYCSRQNSLLKSSNILKKNDSVWKHVFKNQKQLDRFLSDNKVIITELNLFALGYDECDTVINE